MDLHKALGGARGIRGPEQLLVPLQRLAEPHPRGLPEGDDGKKKRRKTIDPFRKVEISEN